MKALTTLIVAGLFANAAIAAPTAATAPGASQVGASSAATTAAAPADVPTVTISKQRSREEVRAEAVQAMKNHKTALAIQLEQYQ